MYVYTSVLTFRIYEMYRDQRAKIVLLVSVRVVVTRKSILRVQLQRSNVILVSRCLSVTGNPYGVKLQTYRAQAYYRVYYVHHVLSMLEINEKKKLDHFVFTSCFGLCKILFLSSLGISDGMSE